MPPHVRPGGTRGRSDTPRHAAQARAGLSAGRSAPRTQGKFAAFDEFCKRLKAFKLPTESIWNGSKQLYVAEMIAEASDECIVGLAEHVGFEKNYGENACKTL